MPSPARLPAAIALAVGLAACAPRLAARSPAEPAFDPARTRAAVEWLADPARTGRGTGTPGGPAAAAWIAARLAEAGLRPAFGSGPASRGEGGPGTDPGYLQTFEAPYRATLGGANALSVGGVAAALHDGFLPFGFSDDGVVEAEVVVAGHGITAPELGHDDYAGIDVKGKVVLVAEDLPRSSEPVSPFGDPRAHRYGEWRYKAINAREHGAAAVLGVRDGRAHPGPDDLPPWRGQVSARAGVVAARVTAGALRGGGVDVAALAAAGEEGGRPHPHPRALGVRARLSVEIRREAAGTANVVAVLPGSDPSVDGRCVVIGAHHDHLGLGGDASLAPGQLGSVHPGADDNASGVAALLEVARALAAEGPARRAVVVAAFGAEELGLLGSTHLARNMPPGCPAESLQLMVNLDTVGRAVGGKVFVDGAGTARGLRERVEALVARAPSLPLRLAFGGDAYEPSDHAPFRARGAPVLFLFTGPHGDYHRPSDTPEKLDHPALVAVARLAHRVVREAADGPPLEPLRAAQAPAAGGERDRDRGYGAYLGAVPDFEARAEPGVLLSGVRPGSPAEQAGLAAGDVLLRVGATRLASLKDLASALRAHRPGDEVEVEWERAGRRATGKVRLGERK